MRQVLRAAICASGIAATPVAAERLDSTALFQRGAWSVEHIYDAASGGAWCAAETVNAAGQLFSIVVYDFGDAVVLIGDPAWRLASRVVRFSIDIDDAHWDVDGASEDSVVSVILDDADGAAQFLGQLMEGAAVAVRNGDGRRLAAFSLEGSRHALGALFECWDRIDLSDPFVAASDPF